ncbi:MAG: maleate cis-trans isomerase family protein [Candidatus Binataceae bacterium]
MERIFRIGQIVPSSNVTMETEIPAMLRAREAIAPERFTFHSSRLRMRKVTKEELEAMDAESGRCALELSDARVDVIGYACLVALMSMGMGFHRIAEARLHQSTIENGAPAPVVSSAGALISGLRVLGAKRVAIIAPYVKSLTKLVVDYIENEGFKIENWVALEIPDNLEVAAHDPRMLLEIYRRFDPKNVDVMIISACVQMPSLSVVSQVESECGVPVISAAICTAYEMLRRLGLNTHIPGGGALLSGRY